MTHLSDLLSLWYRHPLFRLSVCLSVCQHLCWSSTFMSKLVYLSITRLNNHQTLHETPPWTPDCDIIYVNVPVLLKCKTSSHQTLHSASPRCTDSAGILTRWPWPIFCAPVHFTHFMLTFNISSTMRPTTTKPCLVLLLNVRTQQAPLLCDLDLSFGLHWLLHLLRRPSMSSAVRPSTTKPCIVLLLDVLTRQVPWPGDLDLYFALQWLFYVDVQYLLKYKTYNH